MAIAGMYLFEITCFGHTAYMFCLGPMLYVHFGEEARPFQGIDTITTMLKIDPPIIEQNECIRSVERCGVALF